MQEQDPDLHQGKLSILTVAHFIIIPQPYIIKLTIQIGKNQIAVQGVTVNLSLLITELTVS